MDVDLIKCINNPQIFKNLYNNRITSFENIFLNNISIYPGVMTVKISVSISDLPDYPPKRWVDEYNAAYMIIDFIYPGAVEISGNLEHKIVSLNMKYNNNKNLSEIDISNDIMNIHIECHSIRIDEFKGFMRGTI